MQEDASKNEKHENNFIMKVVIQKVSHANVTIEGKIKSEIKFLSGPQSRWQEFTFSVKVLSEFIKGFRKLHFEVPVLPYLVQQGLKRCILIIKNRNAFR